MPKYETGLERSLEYRERLAGISQLLHGLPALASITTTLSWT